MTIFFCLPEFSIFELPQILFWGGDGLFGKKEKWQLLQHKWLTDKVQDFKTYFNFRSLQVISSFLVFQAQFILLRFIKWQRTPKKRVSFYSFTPAEAIPVWWKADKGQGLQLEPLCTQQVHPYSACPATQACLPHLAVASSHLLTWPKSELLSRSPRDDLISSQMLFAWFEEQWLSLSDLWMLSFTLVRLLLSCVLPSLRIRKLLFIFSRASLVSLIAVGTKSHQSRTAGPFHL
jgi:hypothetical protein